MARTTRIVLDMALGAAKNIKSFGATTWSYLKVEAMPPLTGKFFNGPVGQKFENIVERTTNGFIGIIAGRIKEIDAEAERERLEKAAAMKALEEKLKADAKRKKEESLKAAVAKAAEEAKKAKAAADAKKVQAKPEAKADTKPGKKPATKGGKKSDKKVKKSKKPKRTKRAPRTSPSDTYRKKKP